MLRLLAVAVWQGEDGKSLDPGKTERKYEKVMLSHLCRIEVSYGFILDLCVPADLRKWMTMNDSGVCLLWALVVRGIDNTARLCKVPQAVAQVKK